MFYLLIFVQPSPQRSCILGNYNTRYYSQDLIQQFIQKLIQFQMRLQETAESKPEALNEQTMNIEQEKSKTILHKQTDDIQTADEKSRIMIGIDGKKAEEDNPTNKNDEIILNKVQSEGIGLFTKLPSYFLQVQEQSFCIQQSDHSMPETPSKSKVKMFEQKIKQKFISSGNVKKNSENKLTYSGHVFAPCQQHSAWQQQNAFIWDHFLCLGKIKIPISQISKVKCLLENVGYEERKIKVSTNSDVYYLGASTQKYNDREEQILCQHYLWFSQIICNKLQLMKSGLNHFRCPDIPKMKDIQMQESICKGTIYKKSQHLHQWQVRYVVVTEKQLFSYIDSQKEHSFSIKAENVKYIWTRFDTIHNHLVIKVRHGITKTEFGIPITDYLQNNADNWLYAFYRMMMYNKNKFNA